MWLPLIWSAVGLAIGVAAMALWRSVKPSRPADLPPDSVSHASVCAPTVDTHLVLNALNRFAVQLTDDHLQDGMEALGHYLAALGREAKFSHAPGQLSLSECPEAYWRLTEWIHDKPKSEWQLQCTVELKDVQRVAITSLLLSALQSLERTSAQRLDVSVHVRSAPHGTVLMLTVSVRQPGLHRPKHSPNLPWQDSPQGCSLSIEIGPTPASEIGRGHEA